MDFRDFLLTEAEGAILAHGVRAGRLTLKKGRRLAAEDVAALAEAGLDRVTAARLGPGDVHEDEAAARLAAAIGGDGLRTGEAATGRANLYADAGGVLALDRDRLDRINAIDEALTVATLPAFAPMAPGQMAATVKIIPFAAPQAALAEAERIAAAGGPPMRLAPYRPRPAALIQTRLPGVKDSVLDKTARVTGDRLAELGCPDLAESRCGHDRADLAERIGAALARGAGLVLIVGASAIADRRDVLPAAIEAAGGTVEHFGMPVDPGNLLLLARIGEVPVLGLPGCARSPKLNGFDRVLRRLIAGLPVGRADIMAMGVGGLLSEIPSRPAPRAEPADSPPVKRVAAIVLAAGRSSRMGARNKMIARVGGVPMVVRAVEAALASRADPVLVVTGHERDRIEALLAGRPVRTVHNPDYAGGLSTSLKAGLAALPDDADAALICLADMPHVSPADLDRLIAAYAPDTGRAIVVPTRGGRRGNPVLWDRRFFAEIRQLAGDVGAKHLIGLHGACVTEVDMPDDAVLVDIDTPEALAVIEPEPAG